MTVEEYKEKVRKNLMAVLKNEKSVEKIMEDYDEDFARFLEEGWSVEALTPGIINYFL